MSSQEIHDFIFGLAAAPGGMCFAARQSGLQVTRDQGQSWHAAYESLHLNDDLPTTAVTMSPAFDADKTLFAGVSGNILRSQDGGLTWQVSRLPEPPPAIVSLVCSPNYAADGTVFAATLEDGIFRSSNRGANWSAWNFGLLDSHIHCLAVSPAFEQDGSLYAGTESGLFISRNRGRSWQDLPFDMDEAPVLSLALHQTPEGELHILAGTREKLLISTDRGQNWQPAGSIGLSGPVEQLCADPDGSAILAVVDGALWLSTAGGASWSNQATAAQTDEVLAVAAPQGLGSDKPLWLALADGRVITR